MTSIWFIRHGESDSNAGLPTTSAASPALTERGKRQAALVADFIPQKPDLIAASSYLRTQQTAQPALDRYPSTPMEIWPVQEFTYLSSRHYENATVSDRRSAANRYWLRGNPSYLDGLHAESFNQLLERVEDTIARVIGNHHDFILVYSHGWFIRALLWKMITEEKAGPLNKSDILFKLMDHGYLSRIPYHFLQLSKLFQHERTKMYHYLLFAGSLYLPNATIIKFEDSPDKSLKYVGLETSHLPEELIGSKSLDK